LMYFFPFSFIHSCYFFRSFCTSPNDGSGGSGISLMYFFPFSFIHSCYFYILNFWNHKLAGMRCS
jgi:hypothetical protein